MNLNNDKKISIFFLVFVGFFISCFFFASKNGLRGPIEKEEKEVEIKKYAIQTHEYFSNLEDNKFVITSLEELKKFNLKFEVDLKLDKDVFKNNKVFVELEEVSSSGIKKEISDLLIDDSIIFVIKTDAEGALTEDMALWYYVAIIPNDSLSGVNYSEWLNPSDVIDTEIDNDQTIVE